MPDNISQPDALPAETSDSSVVVPPDLLAAMPAGTLIGPWVSAFWVALPVVFKSKSNFRRSTSSRHRPQWDALRSFEHDVAYCVRGGVPASWQLGDARASLASRPVVVSFIAAKTTLDTANLSKSVLDACEGIVFVNDASVRFASAFSQRTRRQSGGILAFAQLEPASSPTELADASAELARCVLSLPDFQ